MKVSVLTIFGKLYEGQAKEVILPGEDGEICIMDFHQPFLYRLRNGYLQISDYSPKSATTGKKRLRVKNGIAKMEDNELVLMVEN